MTTEEANKPITVPDWVKEHFKKPLDENPSPSMSLPNKDQQAISYAQTEVSLATNNLKFLTNPKQVKQEKQRLAENFLILGEFEQAEFYSQSQEFSHRIEDYKQAVEENDNEFCSCEDSESQFSKATIPLSRFRVVQRVFSKNSNQMVDIKKCTKCGFMNATNSKTETEKLIQKRISKATAGQSDEEVF